jgi:uncharacterized membrane protein
VPQLALLVALILVLCSIAVLIFFIHDVPMRIHINNVIKRIGDRLIEEIDARFPVFVGTPLEERADGPRIPAVFRTEVGRADHDRRAPVRSQDTGYIQLIDESTLMDVAHEHDLVIRLQYQPGDFIHKGSVLLESWPGERCDEAAAKALREAFAVGSRRTALHDLHFPIDELVQIAARALSPGVNDPFTANSCLDGLGAAMADLARRDLPSRLRADEDDPLRVIAHPATFESFIARAFGALGDVALHCEYSGRIACLVRQTSEFRELSDNALDGACRNKVLIRADDLLRALAELDYRRRLRDGNALLGGTV